MVVSMSPGLGVKQQVQQVLNVRKVCLQVLLIHPVVVKV